ncbi:VWA domain-containing protein [Cryptosporangium sp. NPDC051539]|uniref:VWA domain-containing protein n=1 Tax=Cryptosporangium sp. NPDC051539 TaxID=3363962 RepID=UPI0037B419B4
MATDVNTEGYLAEISRANPTCFLFLIDQSASMNAMIGTGELARTRAAAVADALNRLLAELTIKCGKDEGVRDYFHIGVIGYGAAVGPALVGPLAGQSLAPISHVAAAPARIEERPKKVSDGAGGLVDQIVAFPAWVDPVADGGTPMCAALEYAARTVEQFLAEHPRCFPPVVLNLTDGDPTDGDPTGPAAKLTGLRSTDGTVLLFNLHVADERAPTVSFPSSAAGLDQSGSLLFSISSVLPMPMRRLASSHGFETTPASRGFVYNADAVSLVQFLDIGTQAKDLR